MPGKGGQPLVVSMPVGPDSMQIGKCLPAEIVNRATGIRPGAVLLRHEMQLGWIGIIDARQQEGIDRLIGLTGNDDERMHAD